jgi:hypothetical protein
MLNQELDIDKIKLQFSNNKPNYVVIENLFDTEFIKQCEREFLQISDDDFFRYSDKYFEFEKYTLNNVEKMPEKLRTLFEYIHSNEFVDFVSKITQIETLQIDDKRWGGGLHKTKKDGYLSIHKDFNVLPDSYKDESQLLRCINLIGYITDEDQSKNDGHLEFWNKDETKVKLPNDFNTWVLFDTRHNFHGHPYPFKGEKPRMSIASYYYKREKIDSDEWSSTEYLKLPWLEESDEYIQKRKDRADYKKRYSKIL